MLLKLIAVVIFVGGGAESSNENGTSVFHPINGSLLEYALKELEETFGKMDLASLGKRNANCPHCHMVICSKNVCHFEVFFKYGNHGQLPLGYSYHTKWPNGQVVTAENRGSSWAWGSRPETVSLPNGVNIDEYEAPYGIPERFVYYLAGVDDENRPLWIGEWGKWNIKQLVEEHHLREFGFYFLQLTHRVMRSIYDSVTPDFSNSQASCVLDFADLQIEQIVHIPTITFTLGGAGQLRQLIDDHLGESIIINANYATVTFLNLLKPVFGGIFNRVTVYGNNKSQWLPNLLRKVPKKSVPEWYGGSKEFKPVRVYG